MKKSAVTQELANVFPPWSKIRNDEQSSGNLVLNALGIQMEEMEKELIRSRENQYLATANADEIDITYRAVLPRTFEFDEDNDDPIFSCPLPPTVSGLHLGAWHTVELADDNDIRSFWYDSIPDRVSAGETASGVDHELLSFLSQDTPQSGIYPHHLSTLEDGGDIYIETTGGVQYLTFDNDEVHRGSVVIRGTTRKGTQEEETLIFPWDMKQKTLKEWDKITSVSTFNLEDDILITVKSADFNEGPYLDNWNVRFSNNRNKIDTFWDLGVIEGTATLDKVEYVTDEWEQLILGFSTKDTVESWELLDGTGDLISGVNNTVSGIDMALQPFTDRAWVLTNDKKIYCYDVREDTVSGVELLKPGTPGSNVQIELEQRRYIIGETIEAIPWHARPLKEIREYRIWYQRPDGVQFGLLDNVPVPFTSNFTVKVLEGTPLSRSIENVITIPTTQRGEYLIALEATFVDDEEHTYRTLVPVNYKVPLATFDLSSIISEGVEGIDFDGDNRLWVKSSIDKYYEVLLHTDKMLIDYDKKIIYFKEKYDQVEIGDD